MSYASGRIGSAYSMSVLTGAYSGTILHLLITTVGKPFDWSEVWAVPVIILAYGLFALPFVALGLAVFGIPLTRLLGGRVRHWSVVAIAIAWGAVAGKLTFYAIDHLLFMGFYDLNVLKLSDMGVNYGVPTGLAWWFFNRRFPTIYPIQEAPAH